LHYGCGDNVSLNYYLNEKLGYDVVAFDISSSAIDLLKLSLNEKKNDHISAFVMDAHCLEFADNSFDAIIGRAILHHLELDKALSEIYRVLRPGGIAIFLEPLGYNPIITLYRAFTPKDRTIDEHPITSTDMKAFEKSFSTKYKSFFLTALVVIPFKKYLNDRTYTNLLYKFIKFDDFLFDKIPLTKKYAWISAIELVK